MENSYCPECNVLCGEKFCWRCGRLAIRAVLKCPHCYDTFGEMVSVIGKFCGYCGKPIQEAIAEHIQKERLNSLTGEELEEYKRKIQLEKEMP